MSSGFNDLIDPDGLLATVLRLRSQEYSPGVSVCPLGPTRLPLGVRLYWSLVNPSVNLVPSYPTVGRSSCIPLSFPGDG